MKETRYYPEDITTVLCRIAGDVSEEDQKECLDAVYDLYAKAQNPYNMDRWRILYRILGTIAERNE